MARKRDRVIALVLAVLFFVTSAGAGVLVILQAVQGNKETDIVNQDTSSGDTLQGTQLEGFTPVQKIDELKVVDLKTGTGQEVKEGDTITADYTGAVASTGEIFQSSLDFGQPFTAELERGGLIEGWIEGIPGMKAGGIRRIYIPASKAYGENPPAGIPVNADLVFDVTLHSIGE